MRTSLFDDTPDGAEEEEEPTAAALKFRVTRSSRRHIAPVAGSMIKIPRRPPKMGLWLVADAWTPYALVALPPGLIGLQSQTL